MAKALVIIPTYNERVNLPVVINAVLQHENFDVLVVDDGSPDRTAGVVKELMSTEKGLFLIERSAKLGLGTAYIAGFKWGLERGYDYFIEMDADGSHDPSALPSFVREMESGCGLAIGSRYLYGTISVLGWDFHRLLLSKFGNYYASWILGLRLTDLTSGFRCYSRGALELIDLDRIHSNGYAFQIEVAYRVFATGARVSELPIVFSERESGSSKMSKAIVREAMVLPWRLRLGRLFSASRAMALGDVAYHIRTVIGFLIIATGIAGGLKLGWWLSNEGDIIEIIHRAKMGLPGWGWETLKVGLSALSAATGIALLLSLAIVIFAGGGKR